jgi:hypothetical protein
MFNFVTWLFCDLDKRASDRASGFGSLERKRRENRRENTIPCQGLSWIRNGGERGGKVETGLRGVRSPQFSPHKSLTLLESSMISKGTEIYQQN